MTYHAAKLLFTGGEVTLKTWKRRMPHDVLEREVGALAAQLFDGWEWSADGEAGIVAIPRDNDNCLIMLVDGPQGEVPCL